MKQVQIAVSFNGRGSGFGSTSSALPEQLKLHTTRTSPSAGTETSRDNAQRLTLQYEQITGGVSLSQKQSLAEGGWLTPDIAW